MNDHFLGTWRLLPEQSVYQAGTPPLQAIYSFKKEEEETISVRIQWTDHTHESFDISYQIQPDGLRKTFDNPAIADELMAEFVSPVELNSFTYKEGKLTSFASRKIDQDGLMTVLQRMYLPDGKTVENVQFYQKESDDTQT